MDALKRAIELFGGQAGLAAAIGLKQQNIWNWVNRSGSVPAEYCPAIERASREKGEPILCEDLCPGVDWAVLRDAGGEGTPPLPSPAAADAAEPHTAG